jgi:hypothetical protein
MDRPHQPKQNPELHRPGSCKPKVGTYVQVKATTSFPNSLLGELVV